MKWTEKEVEVLKELSKDHTGKEIADYLGRTTKGVELKAERLGIRLDYYHNFWTEEDDNLLKELWGYVNILYIASRLKRSIIAIKIRAQKLHLGPMVKANLEYLTLNDVVDILHISKSRIMLWVSKGLKLESKVLSEKKAFYFITLDNLVAYLKDHQDDWNSCDVEEYMLGSEPEWLLAKRSKDRSMKRVEYHKWTKQEKERVVILYKFGHSYEEIAEEVGRKPRAIRDFLHQLGYYNNTRYTEEELTFILDNYKNMTYKEMGAYLNREPKSIKNKLHYLGKSRKLIKKRDN